MTALGYPKGLQSTDRVIHVNAMVHCADYHDDVVAVKDNVVALINSLTNYSFY